MTRKQFDEFARFRDAFKRKTREWTLEHGDEIACDLREMARDGGYNFETAIVFNMALDEITEGSEIKLIVVGDNPGKNEQLRANQKYLVGQSGKIAEGFFARNPELGIDFRKNAVILNKTPVHTPKTAMLKTLARNPRAAELIEESQAWMARETARLHQSLWLCAQGEKPRLWITGCAELKPGGIFSAYREALKESYSGAPEIWRDVLAFHHFSMNRFSIDLSAWRASHGGWPLGDALLSLGASHRAEIFG